MPIRGIRGATVAVENTAQAIRLATQELLQALREANQLDLDDVASVIFTTTPDLSAEAPARGARELGWDEHALLCVCEIDVPGALERCIRVLIHWNTPKRIDEIKHVYLYAASQLRPDRASRTGASAD
jgi:chorismate mutase